MRTLTIILCLSLAQCGLSPAWAQTVEVPEVAPAYEEGGPDGADIAAAVESDRDLAMLYTVPTAADVDVAGNATSPSPLAVQAGSGADTRLGVDVSAINKTAAREGWPTWAKVTVIVGGVAVVALTSWAIVEATQNGEHHMRDDSSQHISATVGGSGNSISIRVDSPSGSVQ